MKFLSILIKPVSGLCNIDCKYCFYKELNDGKCGEKCMSEAIMKQLIDKAADSGAKEILFAFQGGEPFLAGEEYYEKFIAYAGKKILDAKVSFSIQTNGTILSDRYVQILKENQFLVGISLDGPKYIQDHYRQTCQGEGTFERVIANAKRMMTEGIPVNILTVITKYSALRAKKMYQFYKKSGFKYLQFIPCMDSRTEVQGSQEESLDSESYYKFLKELFDCWYVDFMQGEYISIRHFDNWVRLTMGQPVDTCSMNGKCGSYFVIERNGMVYPCDFYADEKHCLGTIVKDNFGQLLEHLEKGTFLTESIEKRSVKCIDCSNEDLCHGGCKRDWIWEGQQGCSRYCEALNKFFDEYRSQIGQIGQLLRSM